MMKPKLAHTSEISRKNVDRILEEAKSMKPVQCVVWYMNDQGLTGVLISEGTERVKTVGALNAMAYDVWNT